jgi:hypothetical protein
MKISNEDYADATESYSGYCSACDEITQSSGVEPDAEGYKCETCCQLTVMGIEQALLNGKLEFVS